MRGDDLDIDDAETLDGAELHDPDDAATDPPTDDGRMKTPKKPRRDDVPHSGRRPRTTVRKMRGGES